MPQPTSQPDPWLGANPMDLAFKNDPYPALKRLREIEPVHFVEPFQVWRLTRYRDIVRLFREAPAGMRTRDGRSPGREGDNPRGGFNDFMLEKDPPEHTRLRRLVAKAFSPRAIEALRGDVQATVDGMIDRVIAQGRMDWIGDLAGILPGTVTCQMLGIPAADRDQFNDWTAARTHAFFRSVASRETLQRADAAAEALADYFEALIPERRRNPGTDILTELLRAEEAGDRLTLHEVVVHVIGLLIAGYETTIGVLGNGMTELIRHPEEMEKLRRHPELAPSAVEECLRFVGPILFNWRITHAKCAFGETTVPADAQVWAVLAAGNRDPEVYPDPDRFDVGRFADPDQTPEHLAFGGGRHYCLGNYLARMEAQIAFETVLRRTRNLRLESPARIEWSPSLFRVPAKLPITFDRA